MSVRPHKWRFFKAGNFEQPLLRNAQDLAALAELDPKLWATLACPLPQLNFDAKFLNWLDLNADGRLRLPEVIANVDWVLARLTEPDCLFSQRPLTLADFNASEANTNLISAAQRLFRLLGREPEEGLTAQDTARAAVIFPPQVANGDGVIPVELTTNLALKEQIELIIRCLGAVPDRSGQLGINAEKITAFYAQVQEVQHWHAQASIEVKQPFGARTSIVLPLVEQLQDKINDYFTRVQLAAYDLRAAQLMAVSEAELSALSTTNLATTEQLQNLPLARLDTDGLLPLHQGLNPAWQQPMQQLYLQALEPQFGALTSLDSACWHEFLAPSHAYFAWQAQRPQVELFNFLSLEAILALDAAYLEQQLLQLVDLDLEVADAAQGWVDLDKLLNFQAYLVPLLKNFVSFENFYSGQEKAVFQAGRLYIDGKSCDLVVEVNDIEMHSQVAVQSNCFLIYCRCTRRGQTDSKTEQKKLVALVSAGSHHELMPGRNGLFYDQQGQDWDATLVKVIDNPVSVQQAFFSPYKRLADLISNQIQKLAAGKDAQLLAKAGANISNPESLAPFDIAKFAGIFAALGLALGALGTAFAATFSSLLTLSWWQFPLVFAALVLVVSGPSMLLAWFKLRQRSLGPILDANGWAVNAQARISINFGASLTQVASLPPGSGKVLRDSYQKSKWRFIFILLALAAAVMAGWYGWKFYLV